MTDFFSLATMGLLLHTTARTTLVASCIRRMACTRWVGRVGLVGRVGRAPSVPLPDSSFKTRTCGLSSTHRVGVVVLAADDAGIDLEFKVTGMMCDGCTSRVEEELAKKDNVAGVKADLDNGLVTVTVRASDLSTAAGMMEDIVTEINGMGFQATPSL